MVKLAVRIFLTAIATNTFFNLLNKVKRYFAIIETISGVFLLIIGVLIFTGRFSLLATKLIEWFPGLLKFT